MSWMICQHRSSTIDEKASAGMSTGAWRYLASIRGSRSRQAASRRKPLTAMLATVARSQARRCSSARHRKIPHCPGRCLKRRLHQVISQRPVPTGQHAGIPEQPTSMGGETRGELAGVAQADPLLTHPGLRAATGRARHLADPHTLRQNARIAQMRSSHQAGARPGPPHHGPRYTMPSQPVPDRGPSHHHRRAAAKGAAAPVASMPAAARQPHRGITKIHRDKSHGRP